MPLTSIPTSPSSRTTSSSPRRAAKEKAVEYARRAGWRAVGLHAYEEGVRLYGMALDALGADAPRSQLPVRVAAGARRRPGTGRRRPRCQVELPARCRARALGEAPRDARPRRCRLRGRFLWTHALTDERLVPLLEDGLSALGEADSVLRVQLLSRLAAALRHGPTRERRERICDEAIDIARGLGDPATLAYALAAAAAARHRPHTAPNGLAEGDEIVSLAGGTGDRAAVRRTRALLLGRLGARRPAAARASWRS